MTDAGTRGHGDAGPQASPRLRVSVSPRLGGWVFAFVFAITASGGAQEARMASDFEIATAQRQLAREREPLLKMAAHLNLGDLYLSRYDVLLAQTHYRSARELAEAERLKARRNSDLSSYATASAYRGLADAKLGRSAEAFDGFEESIRYASDSAKLWNLYASGMNLLERHNKAVAAGRRAVAIASATAGAQPSPAVLLDLGIYRYTLASALLSLHADEATGEAEELLRHIIDSLEGPGFESLRDEIARQEKFEIFSTTRGDADSYLSLMNRARLRLARLYEDRGAISEAVAQLEDVLRLRTDDPTALAAMARLSQEAEERDRFFAESFDANPFSIDLIRQYERYVRTNRPQPPSGETAGRRVQRAVFAYAIEDYREAAEQLAWLSQRFPENDVVRFLAARNDLRRMGPAAARASRAGLSRSPQLREELTRLIAEFEATSQPPDFLVGERTGPVEPTLDELKRLLIALRLNQLSPQQRARLDRLRFTSIVHFDAPISSSEATTTFLSGTIETLPFRFQQPAEFRGTFGSGQSLRLDYRILGATEAAVLLEPLRIAAP